MFGLSVYNYNHSYEDAENKLIKYGLFSLEYRVMLKLDVFLFRVLNSKFSPPCLKDLLIRKSLTHRYKTRCTDIFILPKINNHYGKATFAYFFSKFANLIFTNHFITSSKENRKLFKDKIDMNFKNFQKHFDFLTLRYEISVNNTF